MSVLLSGTSTVTRHMSVQLRVCEELPGMVAHTVLHHMAPKGCVLTLVK
jgi:hypothetical protein